MQGLVLSVLSSLAISLLRKRELIALLLLFLGVGFLCLFITVQWIGVQSVILAKGAHPSVNSGFFARGSFSRNFAHA